MNHTEILDGIHGCIGEHKELCNRLGLFVATICEGRDSSHGYEHMKQVAKNSLQIFNKMYNDIKLSTMTIPFFISCVLTVSWLHDVADHKYDHDGTLKLQLDSFVTEIFGEVKYKFILDVIVRTSYSNEIKMIQTNGKLDWDSVLGADGVLLRNIVSDADKLEAIGYQGILRCMTYNIELLKISGNLNPSFDNLIIPVKKHTSDKLIKLASSYIRTDYGKELAKSKHDEFINIINDDLKLREIYDIIINKI